MPTLPRRAIANGLASVAVACLLSAAASGTAFAASRPTIRVGAVGGVVAPGALGGARAARPQSETNGGPGLSGSSPGGGTPPLLYGGGPVMHDVVTQVVAWAPSADPFPSGYVSGYEHYLADTSTALGLSSNISALAAQYVDASGSALSSLTNNAAINDTDAYPSSGGCTVTGTSVCLTESQILTELTHVIGADALPVDESHSYIVLLPPGIDSCFDSTSDECETQAFCGYHTAFSIGGATTTFTLLPYTESSYSNSAGSCYVGAAPAAVGSAVNAVDSIGAHELFESATDPLVGSGYVDSSGEEIGDECAWTWGAYSAATGGGYYNQLLAGDQYLIQEMWSNQADACELGASSTARATISPAAAPLDTATSLSVALTGDSSAAASYRWSYRAPSGALSSDFSTAASPSLSFTSAGTYTVWVAVTDAGGGTVTAVRDVTVSGLPAPTANFGYAPSTSVPARGSAISFTSSSTASSSQSITASAWSFGDGATATGATASHSYSAAGTYTVTLRVTQSNGQSSTVSRSITVVAGPSAAISFSPSAPAAGTSVTFGAGASAGAGSISAYDWSFGDGGSATSAGPSHTFASAGSYSVTLTVTQTDGLTTTVNRSITVAAAPKPPTVSFRWTTSAPAPTPGTATQFISSATPGNGSISDYSWNFGDGSTANVADPSHIFANPGSYAVTLTVTQTGGLTARTTATVIVAARPTASFSWPTAQTLYPGTAISFTASATPGAGAVTAYGWSFGDGTGSTAARPAHSYARSGTYTVTLTVTQSDGLTTTVQRAVVIAQPPASTSASSGSTKPPSGSTKSTGGPSKAAGADPSSSGSSSVHWSPPSSWLLQTIRTADATTTKIGRLLHGNGSTSVLTAPQVSGQLAITWRATVNHHAVVIARSRSYVLAGVTANVAIRLTRAGRKLLAHQRQVTVAAQATFRAGASASRTTHRLTLRS